MFRSCLRSVPGPVRNHACRSCLLANRIGSRIDTRFYTTGAPEPEHTSQPPPKPHVESSSLPDVDAAAAREPSPTPVIQDESRTSALPEQYEKTPATIQPQPKKRGRKSKRQVAEDGVTPAKPGKEVKGKDAKEKGPKSKEAKREKAKGNKSKPPVQRKKRPLVRKVKRGSLFRKINTDLKGPPAPPDTPVVEEASRTEGLKTEIDESLELNAENIEEELKFTKHLQKYLKEKHTGVLHADEVGVIPLETTTALVPSLSFGLDRVLFNPGVYYLRDPRSRVFNFDPYLGSIMPVTEFDFEALKDYITSSRDEKLLGMARERGKKYVGSSSSMTSVLSHFHYLLSSWRPINTDMISRSFPDKLRTFTRLLRSPSAMFLHYKDGTYAIDADKEFDSANVLMNLGKSMEKLLTLPKEEFERYRRSSSDRITAEEERAIPESYHYSTSGDFIIRSQLDAYDPRLPGTGMFDLKTRAVVSIRMDSKNFEHGLGYQIKHRLGGYESFEREYYDMIRAAFLKYSLQARVGSMDGIFVAFHNIQRIFGFQYISLPEMDLTLHGQSDTTLGDKEYHFSLGLWNNILNKATAKYPQKSIRFHFETRDASPPFMYIFAEPVTADEIEAIQTKNNADIEAFQRRILDLPNRDNDADDDASLTESTDAAEDSPEPSESEILSSAASTTSSSSSSAEGDSGEAPQRDLFAMLLSINSRVNGRPVLRPCNLEPQDKWTVEYELTEIQGGQVWKLYEACQKRRQKALAGRGEDETDVAGNNYIRKLREISLSGRKYRQEQDKLDTEGDLVVLGETDPRILKT